MLEPRREQHFAVEPIGVHAGREFGMENLDHHGAVQRGLVREKHAGHPTAAQFADDRVARSECCVQLGEEVGVQEGLG